MSRKLLIVDRGEFGWTLCALLPRARVVAKPYSDVTVFTPAGREWLWHGVAHTIRAVQPVEGTQNFCDGRFSMPDEQQVAVASKDARLWPTLAERNRIEGAEREGFKEARFSPSLCKQWGDLVPSPYRAAELVRQACPGGAPQVCVAVRPPKLLRGQTYECKSWPYISILTGSLCDQGVRVALVGGTDNLSPEPADPRVLGLRGADLETQCAVMAAARVTVGPSSGPLHLSQLCRTPVVTWYGIDAAREGSRNRYLGSWNPYRTPCSYLDAACPTPADVLRATLEYVQ